MKYYRYMGSKEFALMTAGADIIGKKNHKARTSSHGVCFLGEKTFIDSENCAKKFFHRRNVSCF